MAIISDSFSFDRFLGQMSLKPIDYSVFYVIFSTYPYFDHNRTFYRRYYTAGIRIALKLLMQPALHPLLLQILEF